MQALEFSGKIENGVIRLPKEYEEYDDAYARVIMLVEKPDDLLAKKEKLRMTFQKMKKVDMFKKIENPTLWQKEIRDDWE